VQRISFFSNSVAEPAGRDVRVGLFGWPKTAEFCFAVAEDIKNVRQ
jgi:hypothetical protein